MKKRLEDMPVDSLDLKRRANRCHAKTTLEFRDKAIAEGKIPPGEERQRQSLFNIYIENAEIDQIITQGVM